MSARTRTAAVAAILLLATSSTDDTTTSPGSGTTSETPIASATPSTSATSPDAPAGLPTEIPTPSPDPSDFVAAIDNPYLPLVPGTRWVYEATSTEGDERIVVTVTDRTRMVAGVRATVVRDRVTTLDGQLVEDTFDWFAQDVDGNVWYLGEDTTAFEDGKPNPAGSWEAGVDGAMAGVVMPAQPRVGDAYAQEFYEGEAEDQGEVLALNATVTVPYGSFQDVVKTKDTTPLEPGLIEHKYYARGIGVVFEEDVKGGDDRVRLLRLVRP
jgi:hypothetical protein